MEALAQSTPSTDAKETARPGQVVANSVSGYTRFYKPVIDRLAGCILLVVLSPLFLASVVAVLVSMGTPAIYRQVRVGKDGESFELLKLRTMIPDRRKQSEPFIGPDRRIKHKSPDDPRVSRVGKFLRAVRLDELPQLINVIKGDMSLVGPRPELPEIVSDYEDWQHQRHTVKPGLTGLWQVSAPDGLLMHECTELDIEYISRMSLKTDISILAKTPIIIFKRHGF